ncbi:MAG: hypothetical protein ABIR18_05335 [Chitinophagaceae bacterium]
MPLAKSITPKIINVLGGFRFLFSIILIASFSSAFSQDNSPYSRYGIGDIVPSTNINSRGMGGISAANNDFLTINFNNPASYSSFQTIREATSKKMQYGRAILDVGINIDSRTLREPNKIEKFTATNAIFSHVQVGVPLRPGWGLSFGLRPVSRVSYKLLTRERLKDPNTGQSIDTATTLNEGDGGSYLASIGTGFKINLSTYSAISFGVNGGYFFGKKDYSSRRSIFNDSLSYNSGNLQTKTTYGNLYGNAGIQFFTKVAKDMYLTLGAYGNWKQQLNARQDIIRETYYFDESVGNVRLDSVYQQNEIRGKITYPSNYTGGFVLEKEVNLSENKGGWLVGVDFSQSKWSEYRFYGQPDPTVQDKWELRVGTQLRPAVKTNYFSNVAYRAGFFIGEDYIIVQKKLPILGFSLGAGLPIRNYNRQSPGQATIINLAAEFIKRGNNDNLLKENLFRLSVGLSFSDFWFVRRKYE